jgi:hypothetical protein
VAESKVKSPLGRLQENFSWKDCLGTFLLLLILAAAAAYLAGPEKIPTWVYPVVVGILAMLSAIFTLGRRGIELILRMMVGRGSLD